MAQPAGFRPADLGGEPDDVYCKPAYRQIGIRWSKPKPWGPADKEAPIGKAQQRPGYLYAICWDHHNAHRAETIAYIGITNNLNGRFDNHPTADLLRKRKRRTFLSIGDIDFGKLKMPQRTRGRLPRNSSIS